MKQLYKSNTNKKVAGVCGGIGEYLGIDPTIVRLGFVALSLLAGGGLAVYIIAAIIMPEREARHTAGWRRAGCIYHCRDHYAGTGGTSHRRREYGEYVRIREGMTVKI